MPEQNNPNPGEQNEPTSNGPTPAFSMDDLKAHIDASVQQAISSWQPTQQEPAYPKPQASENPLKAVIEPIIGPDMRRTQLMAQGAMDAAVFYATNPEAIRFKDEIEKQFGALLENGTPFTRDALLKYIKGEKFEELLKERIEADKKKVEDAEKATLLDGSFRSQGGGPVKDAYEATDDELDKALANATF